METGFEAGKGNFEVVLAGTVIVDLLSSVLVEVEPSIGVSNVVKLAVVVKFHSQALVVAVIGTAFTIIVSLANIVAEVVQLVVPEVVQEVKGIANGSLV